MSSTAAVNKTAHPFSKDKLQELLIQRFFYAPAFGIYGGVAGLYDYGPPGAALQANIIAEWRRHFIVEEGMLELDTTIMTPAPVFETSGHVARFADWMVKDIVTGDVLRADHLVKAVLQARLEGDAAARGVDAAPQKEDPKRKKKVKSVAVKLDDKDVKEDETILAKLDNYDGPQLGEIVRTHKITNPDTNNAVTEPQEFNLMFGSSIGPTGATPGFLRPETAQGHFVNFKALLDYNNQRMPFASACVGRAFRNEISPRAGLLRVREFTMAEVEHYVDPLNKRHARFAEVRNVPLALLPRDVQSSGRTDILHTTTGDAVARGIIDNETLGYFVARIALFLHKIGVDPARMRFRQHMANEMAHYAADCWDAEIHNAQGGWTECVGCADRAAFDLSVHAKKTGADLGVRETLAQPLVYERYVPDFNKKTFGKAFGRDTEVVKTLLNEMDQTKLEDLAAALEVGDATVKGPEQQTFVISKDTVTIPRKTIKESVRTYIPNVIEPSFGLGRIFYCLLEHSFWAREDDPDKRVLSLNALVAPTKCLIVPLSSNRAFDPIVAEVSAKLRKAGVLARVDDSSATIGKRYARNDELGTPYGLTIDFASIKNRTVTLRERDTTKQRIGDLDEVVRVVTALVHGGMDWAGACEALKPYDGVQAVDEA